MTLDVKIWHGGAPCSYLGQFVGHSHRSKFKDTLGNIALANAECMVNLYSTLLATSGE